MLNYCKMTVKFRVLLKKNYPDGIFRRPDNFCSYCLLQYVQRFLYAPLHAAPKKRNTAVT